MTKAEAEGKGCPWARLNSGAAINRTPGGVYHPNAKCQTDKCMAWSWQNQGKTDGDCRLCRENQGS